MFADYSNQERTVQEKSVTAKVKRTVTREKILSVGCEPALWKWISLYTLEKNSDWREIKKLLEFVEKQQHLEEEKEERRRILEEDRRREEKEKEERRRREDEERETRRQERELRKLELEADLLKQKEAIEAAKREHELELARLAQGRNDTERAEVREDRAKAPKLPSFVDGKDDLDAYL